MKYLALFFLIVSAAASSGQSIIKIVDLKPVKKLHKTYPTPFNHVVVFDNRYDTVRLAIEGNGIHPAKINELNGSATAVIQTYLESVIAGIATGNLTLYVNIKELRFLNRDPSLLYFNAEAYLPDSAGFRKIAVINRYFPREIAPDSRKNCTMKALNTLIKTVDTNYTRHNFADDKNYSLEEMKTNMESWWPTLPIMTKNNSPVNGIYLTVVDMRYQNVMPEDLSPVMQADSSYTFTLRNEKGKKRRANFSRVYAINCNGVTYIRVTDQDFLPLEKINNRLCFHVPATMPNMYTLSSEARPTMNDLGSSGNRPDSYGALAVEASFGLVYTLIETTVNHNAKKATVKKARLADKNMRDCFVDMETGDIIY
jgi:hypothetical protein